MLDRRTVLVTFLGGCVLASSASAAERVPLYRTAPHAPRVYVDATLPDGSQGLFLVDTGADVSLLSREAAQRLALPTHDDTVTLAGLTATAEVELATLPWLQLGDTPIPEVDVAIDVPGHVVDDRGVPVLGVLGNNVWSRFVVDLDFRQDTLRLFPPQDVPRPKHATTLRGSRGHMFVPVHYRPSQGPSLHQQTVLAIDTAGRGMVMRGPDAVSTDVPFSEGVEPLRGLGQTASTPIHALLRPTRRIALKDVILGGRRIPTAFEARWVDYTDATGGSQVPPGYIGFDVLDGARVRLAYRQGWFALTPARGPRTYRDAHALCLDRLGPEAHDDDATALVRAKLWLGRGDEARAVDVLTQALERAEGHGAPALRVWLARIQRALGDVAAARRTLAPLDADALVDHGEIVAVVNDLALAGQVQAAVTWAARAVALRPHAPIAHEALADAHLRAGDADAAQAILGRASATWRTHEPSLLRRASIAHAQGDHDAALAVLREGVARNPLDRRVLWAYTQLSSPSDDAMLRADLAHVMARTHPRHRPHDVLAGSHVRLGEHAQVSDFLRGGRARDCDGLTKGPGRDNCIAWYLAMAHRDLDEALTRILRATQAQPYNTAFLDTLATVHAARQEWKEAADVSRRAALQAPDDPYMLWQAQHRATSHRRDQP